MGKIILCCPFYNENLVADINIAEASKWVDEIHITEFDKSFKYTYLQPIITQYFASNKSEIWP